MDLRITRDELRKTDDGYELMIYLSSDETEFAKELGRDGNNDRVLEEDVRQYVQKKYPNMKVNVARLMLGGLLLTSVPLATTGMAAAAAPNDFGQTSEWAKASVQRLTDQKVITGDEAGNFNPQSTMDRDAFVTMLVRALNLETVTPDTPTFKDVPKNHWSYQYVETAYANGLIKGDTATTFAPGSKVTREQMATIFVRALGLTPEDIKGQGDDLAFADKASISTYARDAVGFAVTNNLLKGVENNRFAGGDVATREQVAVLADRFLTNHDALVTAAGELKAPTMTASMEKNDLDTILLTFNRAVDDLKAENVTVTGPNGEKIAVSSVTLGADKKTATVETTKLTAGLGYTVNVKTDTINRSDSVTPESDVVTVADATALNLKQVSVTFSGKVDQTTAETKTNYQLGTTNANPASATLLPDGKTVLLVLADPTPKNQDDLDVNVLNVKDANGTVITSATKSVHFLDTTVPTAKGVETVGPNQFKVTFSEPVKEVQANDFLLDNGTYSVTVDSVNPVDNSVILRTGVDLTEAGHTLLINSTRGNTPTTQDYAGFKVAETTLSFDYVKDTAAPAISSIVANDPTKVTVKFSKPVAVDSVTAANFYHTYSGYTPNGVNAVNAVNGFADTFVLDFSNHLLPPGDVTVHTLQGAENAEIKDAWGNIFATADATTTVTVTQDVTKPTVSSIVSKTDHTVQLTFSKSVVKGDAENPANYVFKDATGNTATFAGLDTDGHPTGAQSILYDDKTQTVTFTFLDAIAGGTYRVTASDVKDNALQANEMDDATLSFSVNDTTPPTITNVNLEGTNQVVVTYSEPMKTSGAGSILDPTNYQFAGGALPDGTTITAGTNNKSAVINLPTGTTVTTGDTKLSIGHVADASGNYTRALGDERTIAAATGATVIAGRVQATDARKITVEVNQPLQSITTTGFGWSGGTVVGTSYTNTKVGPNKDIDGALITLTVNTNIDKANPGEITINNATGTKNTFGTVISNTATPVAISDKLAPFVDTANGGGYIFQSPTKIVLNMSEAMNSDTFAPLGTNGFSVSLGTVTKATYDAGKQQIVIEGTGFTANTKVSYNGTNGIKDTHDNLLGAFSNQALKTAPATP